MKNIEDLRVLIDKIDKEMASLYEERMKVCKEVGEYKKANGLAILDTSREEQVIKKNLNYINEEEIKPYYVNFIKEVMKESRNYQSTLLEGMKIGYSGIPGSFSYSAAVEMNPNCKYMSFKSFEDAYRACVNGDIDKVILPIENSYAGDVGNVMDLVFQGDLKINEIHEVKISQNLLGIKGSSISDIKTVVSHPQALNQSIKFINEHHFEMVEASNTAVAAIKVLEKGDKSVGVIASKETAELYGLEILQSNVNASDLNATRFASFSRIERIPPKGNKMGEYFVLVFTVKDKAGALADALNIIGSHHFNMRNLRSRPMKELMWNYYFFVELEGNINSIDGHDLLTELSHICDRLKLVGTYYENKQN